MKTESMKRNHLLPLLLLLIFSLGISITNGATAATTTTTHATTKPTALPPNDSSVKPVTPTGVFSQQPPPYTPIGGAADAAYEDFDDYIPSPSDVHDNFSWALLKQVLREERADNVIISPFSLKLVLAILAEAAGNNTQTQHELQSTLTDIRSPENLRGFYKKTLTSLRKENPYYTLNLATRLYTADYVEPQQRYAAILSSSYDTDIIPLHFDDALTAAAAINNWASNVTNGRLKQLVAENQVRSNVMLLANVIYFDGLWRRPFLDTYQGAFFRTPEQQVRTEFMELTEFFYYHDSAVLDAKILRLPYKGKKFSMFVVLPKVKGGIDSLIESLENDQLKRIQWMMEEAKVRVTMPKFKFEYNKSLKDTLCALGIGDIFTDNASLPGLARGAEVERKLKVSNILQKAGIDVNERGTEAFASTVVEIENKFGGAELIAEFNVNRPFLFFIEEEATGNILFAGKVLEPYI